VSSAEATAESTAEARARDAETETAIQKALTAILKFKQPRTANIPSGVMERLKMDLEERTKERDEARLKHDQVLESQQKLKVEMDSWLDELQEVSRLFKRREEDQIAELQSEIEMRKLEASMNLFYAMLNPEKLVDVPKLARNFAKDEKKLNSELQKNYNGLDLSSNLETLLKDAKWEKELADLKEQLTKEREKRAQCEESLQAKIDELAGVRESLKAFEAESERALKDVSAQLNERASAASELKQGLELLNQVVETLSKSLETARTSNDETAKKLQASLEELAVAQKALQQAEADKLKLSQELEAIKTADQERRQQMTDLSERLAAAQTENRHLFDQLEDKAARLQVD
jgi:hypothetical protein